MKTGKKQRKKEIIMNESVKEGRGGRRGGPGSLPGPSVECGGRWVIWLQAADRGGVGQGARPAQGGPLWRLQPFVEAGPPPALHLGPLLLPSAFLEHHEPREAACPCVGNQGSGATHRVCNYKQVEIFGATKYKIVENMF